MVYVRTENESLGGVVGFAKSFWSEVRYQIRAHIVLVYTCLAFFFASVIANLKFGNPIGFTIMPYLDMTFTLVVPFALLVSQVALFIYYLLIKRPESPIREMLDFYRNVVFDYRRYAKAIPILVIMTLGFAAFTDFKAMIPVFKPYSWDVAFMEMDRWVHFGTDPWRLLAPVFGNRMATIALNVNYNMWSVIMLTFWLAAGWTKVDHGWERQFQLSFILVWIFGGVILAIIYSSMGPAFYDLVDPANNPFEEQMALLNSLDRDGDIWALPTQDLLREGYLDPAPDKLKGISAMPSMHNATSALFVVAAYRIRRVFGHLMLVFLAAIVIASVHLAWHYAIDAYAGIIVALVIWYAAGRIIKWQDRVMGMKPRTGN